MARTVPLRADMKVRPDTIQQSKGDKLVHMPVLYVDGELTVIAGAKAMDSRLAARRFAGREATKFRLAIAASARRAADAAAERAGKFQTPDPARVQSPYLINGRPAPAPANVFDLAEVATLVDGARCLSRTHQAKVGVVLAGDRGAADMIRVALLAGCPWVTTVWEMHEDDDHETLVVRAGRMRIASVWYDRGAWIVRSANDTESLTMFSARGALSLLVQRCTSRAAFGAARRENIEACVPRIIP